MCRWIHDVYWFRVACGICWCLLNLMEVWVVYDWLSIVCWLKGCVDVCLFVGLAEWFLLFCGFG